MLYLKQSTAVTVKIGPFLDEDDGNAAETALTIAQADVRLSKNGGDLAQKNESTSCTHDEIGIYGCPLDTTDTGTLGRLQLFVHETGALPVYHEFMVVTSNIFDSLCSTAHFHVLDDDGNAVANENKQNDIKTATDKLDDTLEDNEGTYRFTEASLAEAPVTEAASAGAVADAVWDEAVGEHSGTLATMAGNLDQSLSTTESNIRGADDDTLKTLSEQIDPLAASLARLLGLNHENVYMDNTSYDVDGNLTSARVRIYSVAASVGTADDVLATYTITVSCSGAGEFDTWQMVKD
jgi:hypothetical protein